MTTTPDPPPIPRRDGPGAIIIPATAHGPGGLIGDGAQRITRDDPRWATWDAWLTEQEAP